MAIHEPVLGNHSRRIEVGRIVAKRDIGLIGEAVFASWCEQEGLRSHRPTHDRLGWDFLLEREPVPAPNRPLDAQNDLPKFLVQAKSTQKRGRIPRIKLSALKHLVDANLPSAIVVLCFREEVRSAVRGLLVPIDESVIEETLRRVRHEEAAGKREINLVTVPVSTTDAIELGPNGEGLSDALVGMLGGDASDYIAGKIKFRKSCGYEGVTVIGQCFVLGEDAADRMNGLFLGGQRSLDVRDLILQRRRFDITLQNDGRFFEEAVLTMDMPPMRSASLGVFGEPDRSVSVLVDFWAAPSTRGSIPSRVRFANSFIELEIDLAEKRAAFQLDFGGARMISVGDAVTIVEIGAILADPPSRVVVAFDGPEVEFPIISKPNPFGRWPAAAPTLRRIFTTVSRFSKMDREVKLDEFIDWMERHIEFLALASTEGVQMVFNDWTDPGMLDGQDVLLAPFTLDFLGIQYTAVIEIPILKIECADRRVTLHGGQPRVVSEIAKLAGSDSAAFVDAAVEKSKRERRRPGPAVVAGGFSDWQSVSLRLT